LINLHERITRIVAVSVLLAAALFSVSAMAATTASYTGVIESSNVTGYFPNGDNVTFSGSFIYDENAADLGSSIAEGLYTSSGSPYGATFSAGGYSFSFPGVVKIDVLDGFSGVMDQFKLTAEATGVSMFGDTFDITIVAILLDLTQTALGSDALIQPVFANYSLSAFQFFIKDTVNNVRGIYDGSLTSMAVAAVPLPGGIALLGAGLALLGFFGWRKKRIGLPAASAV